MINISIIGLINVSSLSILLILGNFFIYLYIKRKKFEYENHNLYLGLTSFFLACFIFYSYFIYPTGLTGKWSGFCYISLPFLSIFSITKMLKSLLKISKKYWVLYYISYVIMALAVLLTLFAVIFGRNWYLKNIHKYTMTLIMISYFTLLILTLIWIIKNKLYLNKMTWILYTAFAVILLGEPLEKIIPILAKNHITATLGLLFITFALAEKFNNEYYQLQDLNTNLEKKVDERTAELEEEKNNKTKFFVNVAHELKTPITLVYNHLEMYRNNKESGDLNVISNNLKKIIRDFKNYLDFDSLERGAVKYNHNLIVNFAKTLKEAVMLFKDTASHKDIDIKSYISHDDLYIKIDPSALDNIINNLLDNAVKYTAGFRDFDLFISVSLTSEDDKIIFTVKDNGRGIPEDKHDKIFIPYYHISHEKRNYEGIGMGLNIVKKIVNSVNGEIIVESKENEGTTFKLIFNKYILKPGDEIEVAKVSEPPALSTDKEVKEDLYKKDIIPILIVEDNPDMLEHLKNVFQMNIMFMLLRMERSVL